MKKLMFPVMALLVMTAASCSMAGSSSDSPADEYEDLAVSIYNGDEDAEEIYSYAADVTTYYSHDRKAIDMEVQQEYRLSLKMINGSLYSRLDFSGDGFPDQRSRSIISSPEEQVIIFTDSNEVLERYALPGVAEDPLIPEQSDRLPVMGRRDIESIKTRADRLSFDVDDLTPGMLTVSYPENYFPATPDDFGASQSILSCKLAFDTEGGTLSSTEIVIAENDGTLRTVTTYPLYSESGIEGDDPVEIGTLTVDRNDMGERIDSSDAVTSEYESIEDTHLITSDEMKKKVAAGELSSEDTDIWIGDLSDPNYTETYLDLYEDIELNTIDDSLFRVLL